MAVKTAIGYVLGIIVLTACSSVPTSTASNAKASDTAAADAYFALDFDYFDQSFSKGSLPNALSMLLQNQDNAGRSVVEALADSEALDDETRARLTDLALQHIVHTNDFAYAVQVADAAGDDELISEAVRWYATGAAPTAKIPENIIEVDYKDRKIQGEVAGKPVTITFDTGAPGVSVSSESHAANSLTLSPEPSGSTYLPAYDIRYPRYAARLDILKIGSAVFRNIPAGMGLPSEEQKATMEKYGGRDDMIMGLDMFRPFFDIVEFDFENEKVRFIRDDNERNAPNMIVGTGGKLIVPVTAGSIDTALVIDTGSANNNIGAEGFDRSACKGFRTFQRSWGQFKEVLLPVAVNNAPASDLWVTPRDFYADPAFGVTGVLGEVNGGLLRIDMEDNYVEWTVAPPDEAGYDYEPVSVSETGCG